MHVCMYACMYARTYVCVYIYMYTQTHIHASLHIWYMCTHLFIHACTCLCVYMYMYVCTLGLLIKALGFPACRSEHFQLLATSEGAKKNLTELCEMLRRRPPEGSRAISQCIYAHAHTSIASHTMYHMYSCSHLLLSNPQAFLSICPQAVRGRHRRESGPARGRRCKGCTKLCNAGV